MQVNVVKVKKSDKGDFYKRQTAWALRDLAVVDAKDAVKVCIYSCLCDLCLECVSLTI